MPDNVAINTGTSETIWTDQSGTRHAQVIKVSVGADGTHSLLAFGQTNMTNSLPVVFASDQSSLTVTATGVTIASITTGTVSIVGVLSASAVTVANITTGTVTSLPSGTQNVSVTNVLSATNITVASVATGTFTALPTGTQDVSVVNTPVVTASQGGTWNIATVSTLLGTVAVSGGGGGVQYTRDTTGIGATGTGNLVLGVNATTLKGIVVSASGEVEVNTINSLATGTVDVANTVTITGTATALPSGTQNVSVTNVLSATGVTIASITTGTVTSLPSGTQDVSVVDKTGFALAATTANVGAFVSTAHASIFDAYAVNTTSGSSTIILTSGAHTIYVTDLMVSVDVPMRVDIFSAATTKGSVYLATKGGFVLPLKSPMVLNSNQSLTFQGNASGSASAFAAGYTVT